MSGMTGDDRVAIAVAVQREWKAAFEARDLARLGDLYADDTAFYGSTAAFHATPDGVRSYFAELPATFTRVDYQVPHVVGLGLDALAATGEVTFLVEEDGRAEARPYRMTHVLVRSQGHWRIATHHASPRPLGERSP